jgi:hypothetical protein
MIDMAVAQKQIDVGGAGFIRQRKAEHAQPRSGIKHEPMVTASHLDA